MRVLVCGSRNWEEFGVDEIKRVRHAITKLTPGIDTVIAGGARGVDTIAAEAAREHGLNVIEVEADWETWGGDAGNKRNYEMLKHDPDVVMAFWDGRSTGTANMIQMAKARGFTVVVERRGENRTQWVRWDSYFKGETKTGKWHARDGFSRRTRCRREIPLIATIPMEKVGAHRKDTKPKSNICSACQKIMERSPKR